ncbi:hypothetical protein QE530_07365 [Streptococcus suis]|uniref:hypothetical protein n=1 Tax=Streptococcus suis TaxID=1307 RepID=UPI0037579358
MANEKLGVLLVDVPEPRLNKYHYLEEVYFNGSTYFDTGKTNISGVVKEYATLYTPEKAKKYPQFRWVALEDL